MDAITPAPLPPAPPNAGVDREVYCPACHYNLFGTVSGRCPECGLAFDVATLCESQIPWVHRKKIGWWKAYWRTVWIVLFNPRRFAREVDRPVIFSDANRFRWVNIWIAWVCGLPVMVAVGLGMVDLPSGSPNRVWIYVVMSLVEAVVWLLFLLAASAAPADWCGAKHLAAARRQRAATLSLYTTASLVLLIPVIANIGLIVLAKATNQSVPVLYFLTLSAMIFVILAIYWVWSVPLFVFRYSTQASWTRTLAFAVLVPLTWLWYALWLQVVLPVLILCLVLMVQSLIYV